MSNKNNFFKLSGKVQHYQWGGDVYIPRLLGIENSKHEPFAEYWMGAHESGPSLLEGASPSLLNQYIHDHPSVLGNYVRHTFHRLPYLFKILDVKDMLSIQVHPNKKAAELEFYRENSSDIPLNASTRNYKDDNHKPELMLALSDFWLLHGFKEPTALKQTLTSAKELAFLDTVFDKGGYEGVYSLVMEMDQHKINQHLHSLLNRIVPAYQQGSLKKDQADFWAARAALTFNKAENIDRGIFSVYLLNLVNLKPGEAIFQDAGILHAYLEGQNVEIMANSDNVLRGGLTPKHIDVHELIKHVLFLPVTPTVIHGKNISAAEKIYETPAPDFELSAIHLAAGQKTRIDARTTEIFIVLNGTAEVTGGEKKMGFKTGEAFAAFAGTALDISGIMPLFIARLYRRQMGNNFTAHKGHFALFLFHILHIMKINKSIVITLILLIVVAALYRVIPDRRMGFAPHIAMALFGGSVVKDKRWAFALPIFSMFLSDLLYQGLFNAGISSTPGFYDGQFTNYVLFAGITLIGFLIKKINFVNVLLASVVAPGIYFLCSNFAVWINGAGLNRPKTWDGLMLCYADAIPFFKNELYATLFFSAVLFGAYYLLTKKSPRMIALSE